MFSKILGRKKDDVSAKDKEYSEIEKKVSKMNLTDMRSYVKGQMSTFELSEDGLCEIMRRLNSVDKKTSKRFIDIDDMDSKIKKAFDLVILVGASKKITIETIELIQEYITMYEDMIEKYDQEHKEIYASRLNDSVKKALSTIELMTEINHKTKVLK